MPILSDVAGLSQPFTKLIDTIAAAIGGIAGPWQARRMAAAEVDAKLMHAEADNRILIAQAHTHAGVRAIERRAEAEAEAKITHALANDEIFAIQTRDQEDAQPIERRAMARIGYQETRHQKNIEAIVDKAIRALPESVSDDKVDPDWTAEFFEQCQNVSNERMQELWARILAGEVAKPGSFSRRTLLTVRTLAQDDAQMFSHLCSLVWYEAAEALVIIQDLEAEFLKTVRLTFDDLLQLDALGLIRLEMFANMGQRADSHHIELNYFGVLHHLLLPSDIDSLPTGHVVLTTTGAELAPIAGSEPNEAYRVSVVQGWQQEGIGVVVDAVVPEEGNVMTQEANSPDRYTTTEAAAVLGVQPRTVTRYVMRGLIPATEEDTPRGKVYYITAADLKKFEATRRGVGYPKGRSRKGE